MEVPQACRLCGRAPGHDGPSALAWGSEREADGRVSRLCSDCVRRHARDIEAKLPHEWW